jgi:hypothetical protein
MQFQVSSSGAFSKGRHTGPIVKTQKGAKITSNKSLCIFNHRFSLGTSGCSLINDDWGKIN